MGGDDEAAQRLATELGVPLSEGQLAELSRFWSLLLTWNARINLTGARTAAELVADHLPDALAMVRLVPAASRVVEVGAGGGLPGIPYALLRPVDEVRLVEPRAKRVAFLRTAVRELGLSRVKVEAARVEALQAAAADVASSRATFAPEEWLERARPLASRALVFAARGGDVAAVAGWELEEALTYAGGSGQPRWLGRFRVT